MGSSKKATIGYRYNLGMHMAICHADIDALKKIEVDDRVAWEGSERDGTITINKEGLFGGDEREGGISGDLDLLPGDPSQSPNAYLQSQLGNNIPAFRGLFSVVLNQMYLGLNPYLKPWSFKAQRILKKSDGSDQWRKELARIPRGVESYEEDISLVWELYDIYYTSGDDDERDIIDTGRSSPTTSSVVYNPGDGQLHTLNIIVDSFAELRTYTSSTPVSGTNQVVLGGVPGPLATWNIYKLEISDPTATYHLNNGTSTIPLVENQDSFSVSVQDGATITLSYDADGSGMVGPYQYMSVLVSADFDMNPAHIIRECLTDSVWGLGYQETDIDNDVFAECASVLFAERMGISLLWDRQMPIQDFIAEILRHINASLYVSRSTGKFVLKLIRDDYSISNLLILDEDSVLRIDNADRPSFGELVNSVTVNYYDAVNEQAGSITVQDQALLQMQGVSINTTVQYPGFTSTSVASQAALRNLKAFSSPLLTATIYANRYAASLNIGDVFILSWPDHDIDSLVMRVQTIGLGNGKNNQVKITAIEDVFAFPDQPVVAGNDSEWVDVSVEAVAATKQIAFESPYYEMVQILGQTDANALIDDIPQIGFAMAAAGAPSGAINAVMSVDAGSGFVESDVFDFCGYAVTDADFERLDTTITFDSSQDLDIVTTGTYAVWGDEIIRIDAIDTDSSQPSLTVGRGCLDTIPIEHADGETIYFVDEYYGSDETEYVDGETINVRILPSTGQGSLDVSSAISLPITFDSRPVRPYPPGNLKINTEYFPEFIDGMVALTLTWAHRDRLQQTGAVLLDFTDTDTGPEDSVTYNLRIYGEDDTLGRTETALVSGYTYSIVDEKADFEIPAFSSGAEVTATIDDLGATISGSAQWANGVKAANGKIYCIPWDATTILIIDPALGTATTSALGATLTGSAKWSGGVLGNDGQIYGIPWDSTDILIIDPDAGTATRSTLGASLSGTGKWNGGVLANDGDIYGIPRDSTNFLIIDTGAGTATRDNLGASSILTGGDKWAGGVLADNGDIYGMPSSSDGVLIIDVAGGSASKDDFGLTFSGTAEFFNGVLASDGKIYGIPRYSGDILIIDPDLGTAVRDDLGATITADESDSWSGAIEGIDGNIYCIPWVANDFLIIDVSEQSASRDDLGATVPGGGDWWSGAEGDDNKIYGAPFSENNIVIIDVTAGGDYRLNGLLRFELESERDDPNFSDGIVSYQKYNISVRREGYGFNYGYYYGGGA